MKKNIYLEFLSLVHGLTGNKYDLNLDVKSYQLLSMIVLHAMNQKPLNVSASMKLNSIASPATLHRYLKILEEQQLIELISQGTNLRAKYLKPTKKALNYFSKLNQLMGKVYKNNT
jgi:DNA-binding MarR family transcriptional regulator